METDLARCVDDQIGPAHDMRDPLFRIVDDHRQQVGEYAVTPPENHVTHGAGDVLAVASLDAIGKQDRPWLDPQTGGRRYRGRWYRGRWAQAAGAGIADVILQLQTAAGTFEGQIAGPQ